MIWEGGKKKEIYTCGVNHFRMGLSSAHTHTQRKTRERSERK
jgi:hypothetical protein